MTGENKGRYFMKIRRFIAAVLAVLALSAFAGCKKHDKDQTDTTGKNDETVTPTIPMDTYGNWKKSKIFYNNTLK